MWVGWLVVIVWVLCAMLTFLSSVENLHNGCFYLLLLCISYAISKINQSSLTLFVFIFSMLSGLCIKKCVPVFISQFVCVFPCVFSLVSGFDLCDGIMSLCCHDIFG